MSPSKRRIHVPTLVSLAIAGTLVAVGTVRLLSYPGTPLEQLLSRTFLKPLTYQPEVPFNAQYFKVLSTLSMISLIYFLFRLLNRGQAIRLDFRSPWLRLLLIGVVSVQWLVLEWAKFNADNPPIRSPAESWTVNALVLLTSNVVAFLGMKHLSFQPLFTSSAVEKNGDIPL